MNAIERDLVELATRQHQVFSRAQARAAGLSASSLSRRVASGAFVPCSPGGLHFAGVTLGYRGRLMAGLLDLGSEALVSAHAAGVLLGLDGFDAGPLEYLGPRSIRHRAVHGTARTTDSITRLDWTEIDGLRCTSATRTVIELLRCGDLAAAGDALDSGTRMRLTAPAVVRRRFDELGRRGRAGAAALEELLRAGVVESWLERRFLAIVREAGLPLPEPQRRRELPGVGVVRVDFEFPAAAVVVEVAGRRGYLSRRDREQKERRRTALQLAGITVYQFTTRDIRDDPDYVITTLRTALIRSG